MAHPGYDYPYQAANRSRNDHVPHPHWNGQGQQYQQQFQHHSHYQQQRHSYAQQPNQPPFPPIHQYQRKPIMSNDNYLQKPQLGATFVPSGYDDFYMPELVSPTPQRIMPEVPSNMQEGLAHLELEARNPPAHRMSTSSTQSLMQSPYLDNRSSRQPGPGFTASYEHTNAAAYQNMNRDQKYASSQDSPKFSPFPKLRDPGQNVPLSYEDKEEVLERARPGVLSSTDPEMQLAWAQDALSWCETASQLATRISEGQSGRSITPKVEHQLREDALNIVSFLADQHHPKAEFIKGQWLEFGKFGHRIDKKEAFMSYKRAAEKGYARAEYRIGMQYETSNNTAKAVEHYRKGVAAGDSASNYRLGMMTLLGQHGMPQDFRHGVDLIRFAAETADENAPQGAYVYGMLLARELPNITVPEEYLEYDLNDAKLFIEKAAYLGFAKAQLKMGQAYELCQLGCEFEPALSLHYNALAARQGESEAEMAISKWFLCGYEGIFEKNEELAFAYAKRAAQAKLPTAEFAMGYFYEIGVYVPVDLHESEAWYQKASEHGNKDALGRIDSIKKNNHLSKQDGEQIAISRIKSQYGSQRGGRPDRFKTKPAPMPVMAEDRVDMPIPEVRKSYIAPDNQQRAPPNIRPVSTAPYPEDDHIRVGGQTQGGLRGRPNSGPIPSNGPQADRPSSAFGIRPVSHAATDNFGQSLRPHDQIRPSTSMGNMHIAPGIVPLGRGSNPAERSRVVSAGWEPQMPGGYREPSNRPPTLPQMDLGRPMNADPGGPSKLQKQPPNMNKPQPQPMGSPGYPTDSYNRQSQPPQGYQDPAVQRRDVSSNQYSRPERGSSMQPMMSPPMMSPGMNQRPDPRQQPQKQSQQGHERQSSNPQNQQRQDSMPPPQGRQSARPTPPQHTMSSQGPDSRASSVAPGSTPATPSAPPPKRQGPATFEEMGIPSARKESECVMM